MFGVAMRFTTNTSVRDTYQGQHVGSFGVDPGAKEVVVHDDLPLDLPLGGQQHSASGVKLIIEASFPAEQETPGNCLRPPMMREQQEARAPLLDLVNRRKKLTPAF
ncbi:hypothetical protein J6590_024690 [Homalodisca vitripennis]|nr:hypothetical protein J6590_024690 [Homalodisca vitripennis]